MLLLASVVQVQFITAGNHGGFSIGVSDNKILLFPCALAGISPVQAVQCMENLRQSMQS